MDGGRWLHNNEMHLTFLNHTIKIIIIVSFVSSILYY
jgi:hypothetical protein